ncbi:MAG: acylneuraminate cytidylyltransferase family protein [Candidatus Magasanikbacteria bacterium]
MQEPKFHIIAVIPARGGSKRLEHKNIYPVCGKPMLGWVIEACSKSRYIKEVFVTSEDKKILNVAVEFGAKSIVRPDELAQDHVFKMVPIRHAVQTITDDLEEKKPDIVVVVQPNSPLIRTKNLDNAIEKLIIYKKQEIFSVDKNLNQNAAFRILTREAVFQQELSTNCGVYITDDYDIHTAEDVEKVEGMMKGYKG